MWCLVVYYILYGTLINKKIWKGHFISKRLLTPGLQYTYIYVRFLRLDEDPPSSNIQECWCIRIACNICNKYDKWWNLSLHKLWLVSTLKPAQSWPFASKDDRQTEGEMKHGKCFEVFTILVPVWWSRPSVFVGTASDKWKKKIIWMMKNRF